MPCLCPPAGRLPAAGLGAAPRGDQPHRGLGGLEPHGLPDCYRRAQVDASPFFRNLSYLCHVPCSGYFMTLCWMRWKDMLRLLNELWTWQWQWCSTFTDRLTVFVLLQKYLIFRYLLLFFIFGRLLIYFFWILNCYIESLLMTMCPIPGTMFCHWQWW